MKCKNLKPKKRRGLSSLVGALIFTVLMVATFSVLGNAIESQTNIVETSMAVASTELGKYQEQFNIGVSTDGSQILKIDVNNLGQNPVEIRRLIITNHTGTAAAASGFPTNVHEIASESSFIASGDKQDIVATTPLKLLLAAPTETELYHFKVISSIGSIKTAIITCDDTECGTVNGLQASLFLDGPNGVNSHVTTAVMFVANTYDVAITDVQPTVGFSAPFCDDLWTVDDTGATETSFTEDIDPCVVTPITPITLEAHESALFKWDATVAGDVGSVFTFCSGVQGTHPTDGVINSADSCDALTVIDPNDCGGCDSEFVGNNDLLIKPGIFMTIPSPFGTTGAAASFDSDIGVWGVNIANPTDSTIEVNKVTITVYAPGANSNTLILDSSGNIENISPPGAGAGDWTLASENIMLWSNFASPVTLGPYSNESFTVKVKPHHESFNLDSILVQASVFSNFGSFGKTGYQSTMFSTGGSDNGPIVNVYFSDVIDSRANANIHTTKENVVNGAPQDFRVVLADMDLQSDTYIKSGAKLIINVPRLWTGVALNPGDTTNFVASPTITTHGDGTVQIIGTTNRILGDTVDDAATLGFSAIAPDRPDDSMTVMYILANGETDDNNSVGPLVETVLHTLGAP